MSRVILPHRNGTGPHAGNGTPCGLPARVVPLLAGQIDRLFELRSLIRQATEAEKAETRAIVEALQAAGCDRAHGRQAEARLEQRMTLAPDPELFLEGVGRAGYAALTVSVTRAREFLGEADLAAISERSTVVALRLEPLSPTKASGGAA